MDAGMIRPARGEKPNGGRKQNGGTSDVEGDGVIKDRDRGKRRIDGWRLKTREGK